MKVYVSSLNIQQKKEITLQQVLPLFIEQFIEVAIYRRLNL